MVTDLNYVCAKASLTAGGVSLRSHMARATWDRVSQVEARQRLQAT